MTIYLLRHPPTRENRQGIVLGASDVAPGPNALAAFEGLAGALAGRGVVRVFSSPLARAAAPARRLAQVLDAPFTVLPGLAELSAGRFEGLPRSQAMGPRQGLRSDWNDRPPGGESLADAGGRVAQALAQARALCARGRVALVGHAVVNRVALRQLVGLPVQDLVGFTHPFGIVLEIGQDGTRSWFRADGSGGPGLPGPETSP